MLLVEACRSLRIGSLLTGGLLLLLLLWHSLGTFLVEAFAVLVVAFIFI